MDGHRDGVSCMAKNPNYLKGFFSGSMDGGSICQILFSWFMFAWKFDFNVKEKKGKQGKKQ